jgi:class 3 adenylate cyclase
LTEGTVTILFTDVEGSTALHAAGVAEVLRQHPDRFAAVE